MMIKTFRTLLLLGGLMTLSLFAHGQALHDAVQNNDIEAVTQLAIKENLEIRDHQQNTPLMLATQKNNAKIAEILILAGADVNAKNRIQDTPHLLSGAQGYNEILALALAHGANLKDTNRYGGTAIIPAAEKGHPETVKMLLAAGADPDHVNNLGWTALMEAVLLGNGSQTYLDIVTILLEGGANPNIPDNDGVTPFKYAKQKGFEDIANVIQQHGGQ